MRRLRVLRLLTAGAIGSGIFWIDTFTPLSSAVAVLYVVVLLVAGQALSGRLLWTLAGFCALLSLSSFSLAHGSAPLVSPAQRLVFSLAAIGLTALLVGRNAKSRQMFLTQARLLDITSDALFTRDVHGRVTFWNKGAERLYGWRCEEMIGKEAHEVLASSVSRPISEILDQLLSHGAWEGEISQRCRDGGVRTVWSQWSLETDVGGAPAILETNTDITQLQRAAEALRRSEARYRTIFDTLAISIWEHDFRPVKAALDALRANGVTDMRTYLAQHPDFVRQARAMVRITDVNATALTMMGVAEKSDFFAHLHDFLPETDESFEQCLIAIDEGHPRFESETLVRSRTGEMIPVIVALSFPPGGACLDSIQASVFNLTERRRLQARLDRTRSELDHALRAASLGVLTASIAHEVNQPIAASANGVSAARRWLSQDPPNVAEASEALEDAQRAVERAADVVKGVRALLSRAPVAQTAIAIDALIIDAARFAGRDLDDLDVTLVLEVGASGIQIQGQRLLLQQVMINLMVNGAQAMADSPHSRILTVRTGLDGDHIVIDVLDTGPGFSVETAERAFEAFYSTKPDGMGLGLAICASTVAAHDGAICVIPIGPDQVGGQIRVRLPISRLAV